MFKSIIKKIFKPTIKAKLTGPNEVHITYKNINSREIFLVLYMTVAETAKTLKMDKRQLMNSIIDLDKQLIRTQKVSKKEEYRQKHIKKNEL